MFKSHLASLKHIGSKSIGGNRDSRHRTKGRSLSFQTLEEKRLLTTTAPDIIVADDLPALTSSATSPGFRAVMSQPDGKVVAAGTFQGSQGDDFTLVRYTSDGQLDGGFGSNGIVQTNFSSGRRKSARHDTLWGAGVDSLGRIVASGREQIRQPGRCPLFGRWQPGHEFQQ